MKSIHLLPSSLLCALLVLLLPTGTLATLYQIQLLTNAEVIPDDFPSDQIMTMLLAKFVALVPNAVTVEPGERVTDYTGRKLQQQEEGEEADNAARQLQIINVCPKRCEKPRNWLWCLQLGCACSCGVRRGLRQLQTEEKLTRLELKNLEKSLYMDANEVSSNYAMDDDRAQQGFLATTSTSIELGVRIKVVS